MNIFPFFATDVVSLAIVFRIVLEAEETPEIRFLTEINTDRGSEHYLGVILRVEDGQWMEKWALNLVMVTGVDRSRVGG